MSRPPNSERVEVLGVGVDPLTVRELNERVRASSGRTRAAVMNANVHALNLAYRDEGLRKCFGRAEIVFCDGAGVVLAARLFGGRIPERITYADWVHHLANLAAREGFSLFFLGGKPGVAERAAKKLRVRRPSLRVVGARHGFFDATLGSLENDSVIREINAADPDILLVGMGMPRQEKWVAENRAALRTRVALTGGAVLDYASGELRRGPRILTGNGFEWLARLLIEPRRLWRRYLIGNPLFVWRVIKQAMKARRR